MKPNKALQLLNGGAIVALLAFLGQVAEKQPQMLSAAKLPLGLFVSGLVAGTLVYITSYLTQLSLHNENMKNGAYRAGKHQYWLWSSFILGLLSVVLFAGGAYASLGALEAKHAVQPRAQQAVQGPTSQPPAGTSALNLGAHSQSISTPANSHIPQPELSSDKARSPP